MRDVGSAPASSSDILRFDFRLLRVPTFDGGLAAAFAISASLFSLLTYLVLYMQTLLGLSALQAGLRFLPLTLAIFVPAGIAGRLSARVSTRLLIAPGFVLIGAGLLLMRGITLASDWTHLLPGMVVAGIGAGLVNVPLASTAVGVVEPSRAGMASGINSTFRQIGIATGVAVLGAIFAAHLRTFRDARDRPRGSLAGGEEVDGVAEAADRVGVEATGGSQERRRACAEDRTKNGRPRNPGGRPSVNGSGL
jgi:predicted MFS family arabinose efflux permease